MAFFGKCPVIPLEHFLEIYFSIVISFALHTNLVVLVLKLALWSHCICTAIEQQLKSFVCISCNNCKIKYMVIVYEWQVE